MDEKFQKLDAWIAEHGFGIRVEYDLDDEPYNADSKIGDQITSWVHPYSRHPMAFTSIKREIEWHGWSWMAAGSSRTHEFAIWDHVRESGCTPAGYAPELGCAIADTEEFAGCHAFKAAIVHLSEQK